MHVLFSKLTLLRALATTALALALCGCATPQSAPASEEVAPIAAGPRVPPAGYELFETLLCYREVKPRPLPGLSPETRTFAIPLAMFVPKASCAALSADGQLTVVEGDCRRTLLPKVTACE